MIRKYGQTNEAVLRMDAEVPAEEIPTVGRRRAVPRGARQTLAPRGQHEGAVAPSAELC